MKDLVELTLVGDIFPGNLSYNIGFGISGQYQKHRGKKWVEHLRKIFINSEIVFGNLEAPLVEDVTFAAKNSFVGSYEFAVFFKKVGLNIVSVSNNHILEQNELGFKNTINCLKTHKIKYVGVNRDEISNIEIIFKKNLKIAFAAFNDIHNIKNPRLYAHYSEKAVLETLDKMSSLDVDFKIISLHWGDEFINIPSASQIQAAHKYIDHGANIIVGHHPHVVQPVEEYNEGLIFYSLGNFLFDMIWSKNVRIGLVAHVFLKRREKMFYRLHPIYLSGDYVPLPYSKKLFNRFHKKILNRINNDFKNDKKKYIKYYKYCLLINRFYQKIRMKLFVLNNLGKMDKSSKKELKKNIIYKIFKSR